MKKKEVLLRDLEECASSAGFSVRYEKGSFVGGDCRVHEDKILVINKFLPLEGRIATIARVLDKLGVKDNISERLWKAIADYT